LRTIAVYSEADEGAPHARLADEAHCVGPPPARESYLNIERLIAVAEASRAGAVHPGYGFLSERAEFAEACAAAGIVFVGPPPAAIRAMGDKSAAKVLMDKARVPLVRGYHGTQQDPKFLRQKAYEIGYPVLIKAAAGGGGKGLKVVHGPEEAERALESAQREGQAYFADSSVYVERYLEDPRHVEVQVLADGQGNVIHLGERDCTIQRRHQKLVEETPSPAVDAELRERIGEIAVEAARAVGYRSAGTIEGLLSRDGEYFFLEMNTRIQVEHTVTEMATGLDLVREQLFIAAGEPLSLRQDDVRLTGHSIECRINAEDPSNGFLPTPGRITSYREPSGPGVRVDSGVAAGSEVPGLYDPLVAKLIVHGVDREHARRRMLRALDEYEIGGITTLLGFHRALLEHQCFVEGATCHGVVESQELAERAEQLSHLQTTVPVQSDGRPSRARRLTLELDGRRFEVETLEPEPPYAELARRRRDRGHGGAHAGAKDAVVTPMQGTVLEVKVGEGEEVQPGDVICIVEAMKMENEITAHRAGVVTELSVEPGQAVSNGQVVCVVVEPNG
jgi:acetyl-CoA/propionyl-CoA carboxylase biotin carboxyl carrier protein